MIRMSGLVWALAALISAQATTVTKASFDDLAAKSTSIVRGRVLGSYTATRGSLIYTYYKIQVLDRWKGPATPQVEVQVPGGSSNGLQQNVAGAPELTEGAQYVLFLWTGPSRATHLLGLSQGVLDVSTNAAGEVTVVRPASDAVVVDSATGLPSGPEPLQMKLSDFSNRVAAALKGGGATK